MSDGARPLILLVEDDRDNREMYASYLVFSGFRAAEASDIEVGFEHAVRMQPRVVVTDYVLGPKGTGVELCQRLKADARTRDIPALLLTGSSRRIADENAVADGCAVVRLKPYMPDALVADIRALISGRELPRQ